MILGEVEETVTTVEIDEETYEELYKVHYQKLNKLKMTSIFKDYIGIWRSLRLKSLHVNSEQNTIFQSTKRNIPMLFVRGDGVILVSPPMRTGT